MIFFYKTVVNLLFVLALPFLPFIYLISEKRRANLLQRLGFNTSFKSRKPGEKRIWIHALSVGEVKSAVPFVNALKEKKRDLNIVFTVSTKTGFETAVTLLRGKKSGHAADAADQIGYFPFDVGFAVKRVCRKIRADSVVLVETDLWPNFLYETRRQKTDVILINARLSKTALNGYLSIKKFSSMLFSSLTHIMAQSILDKKRFLILGTDEKRVSVMGNIKFDQPCIDMERDHLAKMKTLFGIQNHSKVFIAGSTHEGEEPVLCSVYKNLKNMFPELLMIVAPRNPERCSKIYNYFFSENLKTVLMSDLDGSNGSTDAVLVDTMGELSKLYAVCDAAFVGGSMVRQGGHNPLEPAAFGKPLFFGSDMSDFLSIAEKLQNNGGAKTVESAVQLQKELEIIFKDREIQEQMGRKNFEVFSQNSGSVKNIIKKMEQIGIV